jgi:hypothetical protein
VARIDCPQLDHLVLDFFHQFIFDTSQLARFMRTRHLIKQVSAFLVRVSLSGPWTTVECFMQTVRKHLYIDEYRSSQPDDIENNQWPELLDPFTGVKDLFLSRNIALQELVGGRTNEVLPVLQSIHLEGLQPSGVVPEGIGQFVAERHLHSYPIAVFPFHH